MPSIIATIGSSTSNSYETTAEADTYFDERLALATPWVASGGVTAIRAMIMATKQLDIFSNSLRLLVPAANGVAAYYRTPRHWTGSPASATQRLAWPRVGMFDQNGNALDWSIQSASVANPTVIVTNQLHGRTTGDKVFITGSDSTPTLDGERVVTVISTTSFSVPLSVTVAATKGSVSIMPQALKDAEAEFAGQFVGTDFTLNNDVIVQGLTSVRAGSVALTFKNQIFKQIVPDAVLELLVPGWLTDESIEQANPAFVLVASQASTPILNGSGW